MCHLEPPFPQPTSAVGRWRPSGRGSQPTTTGSPTARPTGPRRGPGASCGRPRPGRRARPRRGPGRPGPGGCGLGWTETAWTVPSPSASRHSMSSDRHDGQKPRGYQWGCSHAGTTGARAAARGWPPRTGAPAGDSGGSKRGVDRGRLVGHQSVASVPRITVDMARQHAAAAVGQRHLGAGDLAGSRTRPGAGGPPRPAGTSRTGRGGCRPGRRRWCWPGSDPPGRQRAVGDERPALALGAEAEVLEGQQDGDGERVVELDDVDVGRRQPGDAERLAARDRPRRWW